MRTQFGLAILVSAISVFGVSAAAQAQSSAHAAMTAPTGAPTSQAALREGLRKLWSDHVFWTREYAIAAIDGTADAPPAAARLMKNQEDIGNAIVPYYGREAGDKLTALLKQHIMIAVDVVLAAKANDRAKLQDANARWTQNANDIAAFLSQANPNWPKQALTDAMAMHLQTTTREVVDRLQKNYDDDVRAFDAVYDHILRMSDTLADGIVEQFPQRFAN